MGLASCSQISTVRASRLGWCSLVVVEFACRIHCACIVVLAVVVVVTSASIHNRGMQFAVRMSHVVIVVELVYCCLGSVNMGVVAFLSRRLSSSL